MRKCFLDTEEAGLHGIMVKLQWEFVEGPIDIDNIWPGDYVNMMDVWLEPVSKSIAIIEEMMKCHIVAHNLRFDHFHISKWYNACLWVLQNHGDVRPIDLPVEVMVEAEWMSQFGLCLKPPGATCTLLCSQRGELQTLMQRKSITIQRQPVQLRDQLMDRLEKLTAHLPEILFARRKDRSAPRWTWTEIKDEENGEVVEGFVDIKLNFKPSNALKDICEFKLGYKPKFSSSKEVAVPEKYAIPEKFAKTGYMPFARLAGMDSWPDQIKGHVDHWANNKNANQYAHDDIPLLKMLYVHVGSPEPDSYGLMACQIASCRLRGMEADLEEAARQLAIQEETMALAPVNVDSYVQVREYIADALDDVEALIVARSAKAQILEDIIGLYVCEEDEECCDIGCPRCDTDHAARIFQYDLDELRSSKPKKEQEVDDWLSNIERMEDQIVRLEISAVGTLPVGQMPVIARVREIQRTRKASKRAQIYRKIIEAKKCYPSFNPIGASKQQFWPSCKHHRPYLL